MADANNYPVANKSVLLRPLLIICLVTMLLTASMLMFLYHQDQLTEHVGLLEQQSENSVAVLLQSLDDRIYSLADTSNGLAPQAIKTNLNFDQYIEPNEIYRRFGILKFKIYNVQGTTIYSPIKSEIGETNKHPEKMPISLQGKITHELEFRDTFPSSIGEKKNIYTEIMFMPLDHMGKRIGVIETYLNATVEIERINDQTFKILPIVFIVFALQFAALIFFIRKAVRKAAVATPQ